MDSVKSTQVFHHNDDVFVINKPSYVELFGISISLFIVAMACCISLCEMFDLFRTLNLIVDYVFYKLNTYAVKWTNKILKLFNSVPIKNEKGHFTYIAEFYRSQKIEFPPDEATVLQIRDEANEYDLKDLVRQIDSHLHLLKYVKLNVGGKKYELEITKIPEDSTLKRLTISDTKDDNGNIVIYRDGSVFQYIQQFLRDGKVDFDKNVSLVKTIGKEAKYYGLNDLLDLVKTEFRNIIFSNAFVKLNVGGKRFNVEKSVVSNASSSLKSVIESHLSIDVDDNDDVLINQNGSVFKYIHKYLRDGKVTLPTDTSEIHKIKIDAQFYKCQGLIKECEKELMKEHAHLKLEFYRRVVIGKKEREDLVAAKEDIVFLNLGVLKDENFPLKSMSMGTFITPAHIHFLRMHLEYPRFVYCIDNTVPEGYTTKDDYGLSFDFYTNGEFVCSIPIYSQHLQKFNENIGTLTKDAVIRVLSKAREKTTGGGAYVNFKSNGQLRLTLQL